MVNDYMEQFIPWIIAGLSLAIAWLGYQHNTGEDGSSLKEGILKANLKLDQVCATTNDIRTDIKVLDNRVNEFDKELSIVKRDLETAHTRIDEIRGIINQGGKDERMV